MQSPSEEDRPKPCTVVVGPQKPEVACVGSPVWQAANKQRARRSGSASCMMAHQKMTATLAVQKLLQTSRERPGVERRSTNCLTTVCVVKGKDIKIICTINSMEFLVPACTCHIRSIADELHGTYARGASPFFLHLISTRDIASLVNPSSKSETCCGYFSDVCVVDQAAVTPSVRVAENCLRHPFTAVPERERTQ